MAVVLTASRDARNQLPGIGAGQQHEQPDRDQLEPVQHAVDLRQQAEHDQSEAQVVGLGERMQARQRVGKAQQADRAREEKEQARADGNIREHVDEVLIVRS